MASALPVPESHSYSPRCLLGNSPEREGYNRETTTDVGVRQLRVCTTLSGDRPPSSAETPENPSRPRGAAREGCGGRSQTSFGPCVWGGHCPRHPQHREKTVTPAFPAPGEDTDRSTPVIHSEHPLQSPVESEKTLPSIPPPAPAPRLRARRGRPHSVPARGGRCRGPGVPWRRRGAGRGSWRLLQGRCPAGVARDENRDRSQKQPLPPQPRSTCTGPTVASAAPTETSTRTWCRRWTRRPCAPAWCGRHRPCSASARCTGGCTGWAHGECWALPCPPAVSHPLPYSVTSVFFGGGTPSLASPSTVAAVLEAVAGAAHLPAGAEVTLEVNPSSTSASPLAGFRAAGVNRLSIGVQSLDDVELRMLGREHTAAEARKAVEAAQGLFPGRTSIDLLFGLPGQSRDAWAQRLEETLRLCDDHISLYQLMLERGTALAAQVRGGVLPAPPQDLLADMYQTARNVLVATGFRH
ncbi:radical S-adenosyl methionine domain-containing protein 1, mitochondrial [Vidua macroura]|uniref:radical S-adenosyl methionine domain-containing protein 1, mitochondrial n=1 Tax=Vidua macroura TaxID=187451 RepID=UPI0023A7C161|nr:radical S-adenosyl methionine domain-containing protein 1, mitochondrial [Vidua macroura]